METIRSIIEMLLAINCLLLSIEQYRLHKRIRKLSKVVFCLSPKDEGEVIWKNLLESQQFTEKNLSEY